MSEIKFSTIPDAIQSVKKGGVVIVVDDENRENEGDFVAALDCISTEIVNFMATYGRGLICAPLTASRCEQLELTRMVHNNTDPMGTAFTVSVDLKGEGVTTGISAEDRAKTLRALADTDKKPYDFTRPGHIFPLIAKEGGVLRRTGHTEAAIDLARLAGLSPAGVIVEILKEDGTMARLPDLIKIADKFDLKIISIEQLVAYRMANDSLINKKLSFDTDTRFGMFTLHAYEQTNNGNVHIALTKGSPEKQQPILARIASLHANMDIVQFLIKEEENHLDRALRVISQEDTGAVVFIRSDAEPFLTMNRLYTMRQELSKGNIDALPKIVMDNRDFGIGAQILHDLNISHIRLLSNSKRHKKVGIHGYGLEIVDVVPF